ncbi:MAG: hypothetical protein SGCHY_004367 [Lobulomycetales sp.]
MKPDETAKEDSDYSNDFTSVITDYTIDDDSYNCDSWEVLSNKDSGELLPNKDGGFIEECISDSNSIVEILPDISNVENEIFEDDKTEESQIGEESFEFPGSWPAPTTEKLKNHGFKDDNVYSSDENVYSSAENDEYSYGSQTENTIESKYQSIDTDFADSNDEFFTPSIANSYETDFQSITDDLKSDYESDFHSSCLQESDKGSQSMEVESSGFETPSEIQSSGFETPQGDFDSCVPSEVQSERSDTGSDSHGKQTHSDAYSFVTGRDDFSDFSLPPADNAPQSFADDDRDIIELFLDKKLNRPTVIPEPIPRVVSAYLGYCAVGLQKEKSSACPRSDGSGMLHGITERLKIAAVLGRMTFVGISDTEREAREEMMRERRRAIGNVYLSLQTERLHLMKTRYRRHL